MMLNAHIEERAFLPVASPLFDEDGYLVQQGGSLVTLDFRPRAL